MTAAVRVENVQAQALAAGRTRTSGPTLGADILRLLDEVWPLLRGQGVRTGHNVVVYHVDGEHYDASDKSFVIEAGVQTFSQFTPSDTVRQTATPAGEAAAATHYGDFTNLAGAYGALDQWCRDTGRRSAGVNWEIYGDTDDDPAKQRTDVYYLLAPAE